MHISEAIAKTSFVHEANHTRNVSSLPLFLGVIPISTKLHNFG
jgi:hypothetical protein